MEIKSVNPKLKQDQITKELDCSSSTLQRYRNDKNALLSYKNPPNSQKRKQNFSNCKHDLERLQLTSNDLKIPQRTPNDLAKTDTNTDLPLNLHLIREKEHSERRILA